MPFGQATAPGAIRGGDGRYGPKSASMTDSLFKLIAAIAAIMAISMLVYTCSPYAPLDGPLAPLETQPPSDTK